MTLITTVSGPLMDREAIPDLVEETSHVGLAAANESRLMRTL
jgi:hypothetical protein